MNLKNHFFKALSIILIMLMTGMSSCTYKTSQVWEKYNIPSPDESWSKSVLLSEPELSPEGRLGIDRACEIAILHHPELGVSRGTLIAANARIDQALSGYFPQLRVTASYERLTANPGSLAGKGNNTSKLDWNDSKDNYSAGIGISQTIFDFNKTRASRQQAEHDARAAAHDLEAKAASVLLKTREAFLTCLAENALLSVARETVTNFEGHLKEAEILYKVGRTTKADLAKARVDLSNARLEMIKAKTRAEVSRLNLNLALGLTDDPGYQLIEDIPENHFEITRDEAIEQAKNSRPELRGAMERFESAKENMQKIWAGHFPDISFGIFLDWEGGKFPLVPNWGLGPSLNWDIFNGFRTSAEVREAEGRLIGSRAEFALTEQEIYQEVQTAWLNLKEVEERLTTVANTISFAEERLNLIVGRYQVGRATILEQTDAELALSKAKADEIEARYDYELSIARLMQAMGLVNKEKK